MFDTPIVLFTYNRPDHTAKTLQALRDNPLAKEAELFVFADGAKGETDCKEVAEVHALLKDITGFRQVHLHCRQENKGLAKSIIEGVTLVLAKYHAAIVLEDDMICATNFLNFMQEALQQYRANQSIFSISGYTFPINIPVDYRQDVFVCPRPSSWGWATWQDRWAKADWEIADFQSFIANKTERKAFNAGGDDLSVMLLRQQKGEINSWAIRWAYTHFRQGAYCLYPTRSKILNIGADKSGTHTPSTDKYEVMIDNGLCDLPATITIDKSIKSNFKKFFKRSLIRKAINWFKYGIST